MAEEEDLSKITETNTKIILNQENGNDYKNYIISHGDGEFACKLCDKIFKTSTGAQNHVRFTSAPGHSVPAPSSAAATFRCAECGDEFDDNAALKEHKAAHDPHAPFTCAHRGCGRVFLGHMEYLAHSAQHQRGSLRRCPECSHTTRNPYSLGAHIRNQHFVQSFPCTSCTEVLPTRAKLLEHGKLHSKQHQCCECGQVFKTPAGLRGHFISHTGVKPYLCLYCGKGCNTEQQRQTHTRIHTGERPYKCEPCGRTFVQSTDMKKHPCKAVPAEKKYSCAVCHKKFKLESSLAPHMLLHTDFRPFPCDMCDVKCVSFASLKSHTMTAHVNAKAKCDKCEFTSPSRTRVKRHKMIVHERRFRRVKVAIHD